MSQFKKTPCQAHYQAAVHVLKYLKRIIDQAILINNDSSYQLEAYYDSDWVACPATKQSISGFFIMFSGSPISWKSKKQVNVSLSSAEAKYRLMRRVTAELAWINRLYAEFEVPNITLVPLKCENMATIYIASNPVFHERTKHIEIDCHFVRDKV